MLLSILIPSMPERSVQLVALTDNLYKQIRRDKREGQVEIITYVTPRRTAGGPTISEKRNTLLERANGLYLVMIDDDDDVHPLYISHIMGAIEANPGAICIGHEIAVKHPNGKRRLARVSNTNDTWRHDLKGEYTYEQPPYYKIPIRRDAYAGFRFSDQMKWSEDDYMSRILRPVMKGKPEVFIKEALYTYNMPVNVNPNKRY